LVSAVMNKLCCISRSFRLRMNKPLAFLSRSGYRWKLKLSELRKRTISTEPPPLFLEVSANFAERGCRVVSVTDFLDPGLLSYTHEAEWPRSRPTTSQKIWYTRKSKPGPLDP
jgi:hypothetical protein